MTTAPATARSRLRDLGRPGSHDDGASAGPEPVDLLLAAAAFAFPVAYVDVFLVPSFTPRMALVLLLLPIGAIRLIRTAARRDGASIAALAMLAACAVATLVGGAPLWNLRGGFGRESSLVFIGGVFAIWAVARDTTSAGRRLVVTASLLGLSVTAVVGVVQMVIDPTGFLAMIGSRPSGLLVNPVYFGPAMAGAAVLVAHLTARESLAVRVGAVGVAAFVALVNLSGSRAAIIGLVIGLLAAVGAARSTRLRAAILASAGAGLLVSIGVARFLGGRDAVERAGGDSDGRWQIWTYAWDAFLERPLTGHGLGQFRAAVQPHFEPEFAAEHLAGGGGVAWPDAHNVIVQYAVVGGVVTAASLVAFAVLAGRRASGPAAWGVVAIAVSWLLQPVTLVTAPIVAIWLGVAATPGTGETTDVVDSADGPPADTGGADDDPADTATGDDSREQRRRIDALLLAAGALVALTLVGLDLQLKRAVDAADAREFVAWAKVAPGDPVIAGTTASLSTRFGSRAVGLEWSQRAVDLEPRDAVVIADHAIRLFEAGRTDDAATTIRTALDVDRYNPYALRVGAAIGTALDDSELVALVRSLGCEVVEELCAVGD